MNYEIPKFGTLAAHQLYGNFDPNETLAYRGGSCDVADTIEGKEITWIYIPSMGIYVADHCLFKNISWHLLKLEDFVRGKRVVIDHHVYNCRLLHSEADCNNETEWDHIVNALGDDVDLLNHDIMSWATDSQSQGKVQKTFGKSRIIEAHVDRCYDECGFRPVLEPMLTDKKMTFTAYGALGSAQFGTLCLNELQLPQMKKGEIPRWHGEEISFSDSDLEMGLPWLYVKKDNYFISQQCFLSNISWKDLYDQGWVDGKEIVINDRKFFCRIPHVDIEDKNNEWDKTVKLTRKSEKRFPTKNIYTWGIEARSDSPEERIIRGYCSPNSWNSIDKSYCSPLVGVRFVLFPV